MRNVVQDSPGCDMLPFNLDKVEINSVEEERERFQEHETSHQVMDLKHRMTTLLQDKEPEDSGQQEEYRQHSVQCGQRHLSCGQVVAVIVLLNLHIEVECHQRVVVVIGTTVEVQIVQTLLLLGSDKDHELEGGRY